MFRAKLFWKIKLEIVIYEKKYSNVTAKMLVLSKVKTKLLALIKDNLFTITPVFSEFCSLILSCQQSSNNIFCWSFKKILFKKIVRLTSKDAWKQKNWQYWNTVLSIAIPPLYSSVTIDLKCSYRSESMEVSLRNDWLVWNYSGLA